MMVSFLLANRFPLLLLWGPQYIQIYNDAYRPIPGAKHPNSLGQRASECWPEIWHILKPLIDTPFAGGPSTWMEDLAVEPKRHGFFEETHFTVAYSPVPDDTAPGGIGGVLATVHEITGKVIGERRVTVLRDLGTRSSQAKTAEEAGALAASVLSNHAKDVPFALIYLIDSKGEEARLAGTAGIEPGAPVSPLSMPIGSSKAAWPIAQALRRRELIVVEDLATRFAELPPGPWSDPPHEAVVIPLRSGKPGEVAGFVIAGVSSRLRLDPLYRSFFDLMTTQIGISIGNARAYEEERRRVEALAEIDRAKTIFFSNVSHEFRTPLTLMLGPIEQMLALPASALPQSRDDLALVHRSGLRLLRLVNTLLDFSRIEAGRVQASYEPVDLATVTSDLASEFRAATDKAGLRLTVDCPPLGEPVWIDRDMWEKIVLNLLSNAFKFTIKGAITVRMRTESGHVVLAVEDTGIGIPSEELPRIFERFHRVQGARGRSHEGTGIGLALVQELAKQHGGSARAESRMGAGSTFIVTIPLGSRHLPADRIAGAPLTPTLSPQERGEGATAAGGARTPQSTGLGAQPYVEEALRWLIDSSSLSDANEDVVRELVPELGTPSESAGNGATVLVVDDNADIREYLRRLLASRYHVRTAADGIEALKLIRAERPDLVLSDVMMPRLDGFGLVRAARADPALADVPIILLSARAGEEASIEGLEVGADDYLIKPFGSRELVARVSANLDMAKLRRQYREEIAADLRAMSLLREVATECVRTGVDPEDCLHRIVEAAIAIAGAEKGNLQLLEPEVGALRIAAQRGFGAPFLEFFAHVRDDAAACAAALRAGEQVIVDDVTTSEIFAGRVSQKVLIEAGVRAVISTPLVSSQGAVLGMISTHFGTPHRPNERTLHFLSLLSRQAADYLERTQAREVEQILVRELQHRSNNLLAVVQSIVHGSLSASPAMKSARAVVEPRLHALARANQQLTSSDWRGLHVSSIVRAELAPFLDRTVMQGPDVMLGPRNAQNLSLAVHELATNAAKYGALSAAAGKVEVSWKLGGNGKQDVLKFNWRENGGPPVRAPTKQGFGSTLLKAMCADVRFDFAQAGLACDIEMPLGQEETAPAGGTSH
jgi:signal transduction histidine kinase/CheY-like chemotaxis protein